MSYLVIDDFRVGMDRRQPRISGKPGALWAGINGHITRGGSFERRKKLVKTYTLPAGTFGLTQVSGQLYVVGSIAAPGGMPVSVLYQRLQHPDGSTAMTSARSVNIYGGKPYVVAEYADGNLYHFYAGVRVVSWDNIAALVSSNNAVAASLALKVDQDPAYVATATGAVVTITAQVPGVLYTISSSAVNGGAVNDQTLNLVQVQPNVAAVAEVRAIARITVTGGTNNPGINRMTSITVNGVEILGTAINWAVGNTSTAAAIAAKINDHTTSPSYTAVSSGAVVTITAAAGTGSGPNGFVVNTTNQGDVTDSHTNMAGGVTSVTAQAQVYTATVGGTFEANDNFTLTIDGKPSSVSGAAAGTGTMAITYQQKVYSVTTSLMYFSALNAPTQFGSGLGNGFINMANQNGGNDTLVTLQEYQNRLAIFSRRNIRIWSIDVDPDNNVFQQTVQNTGTVAPRSVIPYGNLDVFYLADDGVRSLRARDASNAPAVNDVGVAIDPFIREYLDTLTDAQIERATALIEPLDGRYWLAIGRRIFVFSYFPGAKINAWTYYECEEIGAFDVSDMVRSGNQIFLRAGNDIYAYGGLSGKVYPDDDEIEAVIETPFLAAGTPATFKGLRGIDLGFVGTWRVSLLPDPTRETVEQEVGVFAASTYSKPIQSMVGRTPIFALRMVCNRAGYALVASVALHYKAEKAE